MAKLRVSATILEELLFGFSPNHVRVIDALPGPCPGDIIFEIEGLDVPDAAAVDAHFTVQVNRAQQRFVTLKFEPVP